MSGLNGIISSKEKKISLKRIFKMNNAIEYRGEGQHIIELEDNKVAVSHLAYRTEKSSYSIGQPTFKRTKNWIMLFDGEIYNFDLIKKSVGNKRNNNLDDSSVLMLYIKKCGVENFLKQVNGVYAMVLHNIFESKTYLIRDRLGVKPLFYSITDNGYLIFSSEIKGILSSGLIQPSFFEAAIDEYLANRYIRPPFTFFNEIFQVEPSQIITIDKDLKTQKEIYWQLPDDFNVSQSYDENKIANEFHQNLLQSLQKRVSFDQPIGSYLSGGVDSSILTAMTRKVLKKDMYTYTIGFTELNEFKYSNLVADLYNTKHTSINMETLQYFDNIDKIIANKDAPLGVPNEIPLYFLSKKIKKDTSIILSGEGADELLGGYGRIFRSSFEYEKNKIDTNNINFYDYFISLYEYVPRTLRDSFINTSTTLREYFDDILIKDFKKYSNEQNIFRYFHKYHVQSLLQRLDIATSSSRIMVRSPFIDHELIEYAYESVPYDLKLKWKSERTRKLALNKKPMDYSEILDIPKYLLKKIGESYLPKEILYRSKKGFPVPLNNWIDIIEDMALTTLSQAPWLKKGRVERLLNESKQSTRIGQILWMLINIEKFRVMYFTKKWTW